MRLDVFLHDQRGGRPSRVASFRSAMLVPQVLHPRRRLHLVERRLDGIVLFAVPPCHIVEVSTRILPSGQQGLVFPL